MYLALFRKWEFLNLGIVYEILGNDVSHYATWFPCSYLR